MSDLSVSKVGSVIKQADILIGQIKEIVDYYSKSMMRLRESLMTRPEVKKVIDRLKMRESHSLTGADMSHCIEALETGNYYVNKDQVI